MGVPISADFLLIVSFGITVALGRLHEIARKETDKTMPRMIFEERITDLLL